MVDWENITKNFLKKKLDVPISKLRIVDPQGRPILLNEFRNTLSKEEKNDLTKDILNKIAENFDRLMHDKDLIEKLKTALINDLKEFAKDKSMKDWDAEHIFNSFVDIKINRDYPSRSTNEILGKKIAEKINIPIFLEKKKKTISEFSPELKEKISKKKTKGEKPEKYYYEWWVFDDEADLEKVKEKEGYPNNIWDIEVKEDSKEIDNIRKYSIRPGVTAHLLANGFAKKGSSFKDEMQISQLTPTLIKIITQGVIALAAVPIGTAKINWRWEKLDRSKITNNFINTTLIGISVKEDITPETIQGNDPEEIIQKLSEKVKDLTPVNTEKIRLKIENTEKELNPENDEHGLWFIPLSSVTDKNISITGGSSGNLSLKQMSPQGDIVLTKDQPYAAVILKAEGQDEDDEPPEEDEKALLRSGKRRIKVLALRNPIPAPAIFTDNDENSIERTAKRLIENRKLVDEKLTITAKDKDGKILASSSQPDNDGIYNFDIKGPDINKEMIISTKVSGTEIRHLDEMGKLDKPLKLNDDLYTLVSIYIPEKNKELNKELKGLITKGKPQENNIKDPQLIKDLKKAHKVLKAFYDDFLKKEIMEKYINIPSQQIPAATEEITKYIVDNPDYLIKLSKKMKEDDFGKELINTIELCNKIYSELDDQKKTLKTDGHSPEVFIKFLNGNWEYIKKRMNIKDDSIPDIKTYVEETLNKLGAISPYIYYRKRRWFLGEEIKKINEEAWKRNKKDIIKIISGFALTLMAIEQIYKAASHFIKKVEETEAK